MVGRGTTATLELWIVPSSAYGLMLVGLAPGIGVIELRLLPETKTNRTKVADIVIA
jgi:hypothetical protein